MRPMQQTIISELHVKPTIDARAEIDARVGFLVDYLEKTGTRGFVLGISGGQDSSLAGRLCQLAVERLDAERAGITNNSGLTNKIQPEFIAVRLPYAVQRDEDDAQLALEFIQPERTVTYNIQRGVDGFEHEYQDAIGNEMSDFTKGNVKARARMIAQYAIAGQRGLLVVGTDHAAEAVTGFFTKFGDGGADILPLTGLSKRQGRALLQELGAPERLYLKEPTADLLDDNPGQTDEANLGLSYEHIDDFLEGHEVPDAVAEQIEARYVGSRHKRTVPVTPFNSWWR